MLCVAATRVNPGFAQYGINTVMIADSWEAGGGLVKVTRKCEMGGIADY
jgi:hypothetical protein